MKRGEVVIAVFPHSDGSPAVRRPCLIVQADYYNERITNVLVAAITTNLKRRSDPAHLLIDVATPDGKLTGLATDSVVSCLNLAVVPAVYLGPKIGEFSAALMSCINECLKAALQIT